MDTPNTNTTTPVATVVAPTTPVTLAGVIPAEAAPIPAPIAAVAPPVYYAYKVLGKGRNGKDIGVYVGPSSTTLNATQWAPPTPGAGQVAYWTGLMWYVGTDYTKATPAGLVTAYQHITKTKFSSALRMLQKGHDKLEVPNWPVHYSEALRYQTTGASPFITALAGTADPAATAASIVTELGTYYAAYAKLLSAYKVNIAKTNIVLSDIDMVYVISSHIV